MNRLPVNGQTLLDLRKRGKRPESVTLVSLVGFLPYSNFQLCADPADTYDWTPIAGLDVELITDMSVPMAALLRQLAAIIKATPDHLVLGYREGYRIEVGHARYALQSYNPNVGRMLFDPFPMAVGPAHLCESMKIEKRLWAELDNALPIPFDASEQRIVTRMNQEIRRGNDD